MPSYLVETYQPSDDVQRVVGHLRDAVEDLAMTLAENAPLTLKATKQMIERLTGPSSDVRRGADWYREIFRSRDFQEGLDAFFAERKPEFHGE